jgi:hypothetical protein
MRQFYCKKRRRKSKMKTIDKTIALFDRVSFLIPSTATCVGEAAWHRHAPRDVRFGCHAWVVTRRPD